LLSGARAEGTLDLVRRVYLGSALLKRGRPSEAARVLDGAAGPSLPDPWGTEARWDLYLVLTGTGSTAEAERLLADLAREQGDLGERARALLGR